MKANVNGVTIINTVKVTIVQINRELIYERVTVVHLPEWVERVLKVSSACLKTPVNPEKRIPYPAERD
jgi:hypothetical protein